MANGPNPNPANPGAAQNQGAAAAQAVPPPPRMNRVVRWILVAIGATALVAGIVMTFSSPVEPPPSPPAVETTTVTPAPTAVAPVQTAQPATSAAQPSPPAPVQATAAPQTVARAVQSASVPNAPATTSAPPPQLQVAWEKFLEGLVMVATYWYVALIPIILLLLAGRLKTAGEVKWAPIAGALALLAALFIVLMVWNDPKEVANHVEAAKQITNALLPPRTEGVATETSALVTCDPLSQTKHFCRFGEAGTKPIGPDETIAAMNDPHICVDSGPVKTERIDKWGVVAGRSRAGLVLSSQPGAGIQTGGYWLGEGHC